MAKNVTEPTKGEHQGGMGQDIANDDPLDHLDRRAKSGGDVGKGDVDRAVERHDRRAETDQHELQPLPRRHPRPSRHTRLWRRFRRHVRSRVHGANCGRGARSSGPLREKIFAQDSSWAKMSALSDAYAKVRMRL